MSNPEKSRINKSTFSELVENQSANLIRYVTYHTNNIETSREIVQEAFLKLAKTDVRPIQDHLIPWLYTVCRNLAIDRKRKESRIIMKSEEVLDIRNASKELDPMKANIQIETSELLKKCIHHLPAMALG